MDARETHEREARSGEFHARAPECIKRSCANALVRIPEFAGDVASRKRKTRQKSQILRASSGWIATGPRRSGAIREKIIGHRMDVFSGLGAGELRHGKFACAVLHQPARQQGRGSFFHPLIDQGRNFLSQVGRMAQPGKFVALQAVSGRREKELPRRLCLVAGQRDLLRGIGPYSAAAVI